MKKWLALVLTLCLVLTAVSAFATADLLSREGVYPLHADSAISPSECSESVRRSILGFT